MTFPAGVATTHVVGTYITAEGNPVEGVISFTPTVALKHIASNTVISTASWDVRLKGNGSFDIELPVCQSALIPNTFLYQVHEQFGSLSRKWNIRLDESMGSQVSLVSLSPAAPPTMSNIYPTLSEVAAVAAALDNDLYARMDALDAGLQATAGVANEAFNADDLGVVLPPLVAGKIPPSFIPPVPTGNYYPVTSQAAMLLLPAVRGDFALRSDVGKTYVLSQDDPTVVTNWLDLPSGGSVASVNGKTGAVSLTNLDVNAAAATHSHTTLPALASLNVTSATITTASATNASLGGVSTLRTVFDANGTKAYDSTGAMWYREDHATKTRTTLGGANRWTPVGQTAGGYALTAPTYYLVSGNVHGTQSISSLNAPPTTAAGISQAWIADYDTVANTYVNVTATLDTASVLVSGATKKLNTTITPSSWTTTLTNSASTASSVSLSNLVVAGGRVSVEATEIQANHSSVWLGDPTTTTQRVYFNQLQGNDGKVYQRKSYLGQPATGGSILTEVLLQDGIEVARFSLTPDGLLQVRPAGKATGTVLIDTYTGILNLTPAAGWSLTATGQPAGYAHLRVANGVAFLSVRVYRTGAALVPGANGNLFDTVLCTVPSTALAGDDVWAAGGYDGSGGPSMGMGYVKPTGEATLAFGTAGSTVSVGSVVYLSWTYLVART